MDLLDQKAPGLSAQLQALPLDRRRRVVAKTCQVLSRSVVELEPCLMMLLRHAVEKNALDPEQIQELRQYAENADKRYFSLQEEQVNKRIWGNWFSKARLATALAEGFGSADLESTARAVYEALFVVATEDSTIKLVWSEINSLSKM
jgi:hypothetical protein